MRSLIFKIIYQTHFKITTTPKYFLLITPKYFLLISVIVVMVIVKTPVESLGYIHKQEQARRQVIISNISVLMGDQTGCGLHTIICVGE